MSSARTCDVVWLKAQDVVREFGKIEDSPRSVERRRPEGMSPALLSLCCASTPKASCEASFSFRWARVLGGLKEGGVLSSLLLRRNVPRLSFNFHCFIPWWFPIHSFNYSSSFINFRSRFVQFANKKNCSLKIRSTYHTCDRNPFPSFWLFAQTSSLTRWFLSQTSVSSFFFDKIGIVWMKPEKTTDKTIKYGVTWTRM